MGGALASSLLYKHNQSTSTLEIKMQIFRHLNDLNLHLGLFLKYFPYKNPI